MRSYKISPVVEEGALRIRYHQIRSGQSSRVKSSRRGDLGQAIESSQVMRARLCGMSAMRSERSTTPAASASAAVSGCTRTCSSLTSTSSFSSGRRVSLATRASHDVLAASSWPASHAASASRASGVGRLARRRRGDGGARGQRREQQRERLD